MSQVLTGELIPGLSLQAQLGLQQSLGWGEWKEEKRWEASGRGDVPIASGGTAAGLSGGECGREGEKGCKSFEMGKGRHFRDCMYTK